ncbi:SixA phosphatase family protein [Botrimarina mediterranea]|uniref:Phosphohistidine phosphatase SixA n=1 Tax=Botrimarina mediterranea TaxID=2528022 RepID=A0A518KER0_9BACT|nr:histidine phosphatase family protein [Botrimarina mediterranea]QDV76279.1 Phosphohistidine phosphatase SixA [Botrimarina mediterranea]QDV80877.1 Phosphohistidine phosphatase SixA [Planctomycetes bacterium K2D]
MLIYIARHAWAGNYGDPNWPDDSERPLTAEGIERYRDVVAALAARDFAPERIATSPYVRCVQTAELIATGLEHSPAIDELEDLAVGAELEPLLEWSIATGAESVCWVGHNPDVERMTASLIGEGYASVRFAKGSVAAIRFDEETPRAGEGTLLWHATAKLLGV